MAKSGFKKKIENRCDGSVRSAQRPATAYKHLLALSHILAELSAVYEATPRSFSRADVGDDDLNLSYERWQEMRRRAFAITKRNRALIERRIRRRLRMSQ